MGGSATFYTGVVTSQVLAIYISHLALVCRQGLKKVCQHTVWGQPQCAPVRPLLPTCCPAESLPTHAKAHCKMCIETHAKNGTECARLAAVETENFKVMLVRRQSDAADYCTNTALKSSRSTPASM